jgi:hypothetical protein
MNYQKFIKAYNIFIKKKEIKQVMIDRFKTEILSDLHPDHPDRELILIKLNQLTPTCETDQKKSKTKIPKRKRSAGTKSSRSKTAKIPEYQNKHGEERYQLIKLRKRYVEIPHSVNQLEVALEFRKGTLYKLLKEDFTEITYATPIDKYHIKYLRNILMERIKSLEIYNNKVVKKPLKVSLNYYKLIYTR